MPAGIDINTDAAIEQRLCKCDGKFRLSQAFSARKRYTALFTEKRSIGAQKRRKRLGLILHAVYPKRTRGTTLCRFGTLLATASTAGDAFSFEIRNLPLKRKAFRIVAPQAAKRASFKKHRGSQPLAVVNLHALDSRNPSLHRVDLSINSICSFSLSKV